MAILEDNLLKVIDNTAELKCSYDTSGLDLIVDEASLKLVDSTNALSLTSPTAPLSFCSKSSGLALVDKTKVFYLGHCQIPLNFVAEEEEPASNIIHKEEMLLFFEDFVDTHIEGPVPGTSVFLIFSNAYLRSTDGGFTWEQFATPGNQYIYNATYGNGVFIFSPPGGGIYASTDYGLTFSLVYSDGFAYGRFTYTDGLGFIGTGGGGLITSPDGITWTLYAGKSIGGHTTVAYNGTTALAGSNGGLFMYRRQNTPDIHGNPVWGNSEVLSVFVRSINGGSAQYVPQLSRFFVASGSSVQVSANNGTSWTEEENGTLAIGSKGTILWDNNRLLVGGDTGIIESPNGLAPWSLVVNGLAPVYNSGGYLLGGSTGGYLRAFQLTTFSQVYTSPDLISWTPRALPWGSRYMTSAAGGIVPS